MTVEAVRVNPVAKWMLHVKTETEAGLVARILDATVFGQARGLRYLLLQPDLGAGRCSK
jgi:hypothetical protein